jgi:hypothetical protein
MQLTNPYQLNINKQFTEDDLLKGVYIAVIHATRTPPHIGLIINGKYNSLTIKGQDIDVSVAALIKNTTQRQIPSLFIKIKPHSTFSDTYLNEHFITNIQQFPKVAIAIATCLSPVKLFFDEVYNVSMDNINYLFELIPKLNSEGLVENISTLFVDAQKYQLPVYTSTEINQGIEQAKQLSLNISSKKDTELISK